MPEQLYFNHYKTPHRMLRKFESLIESILTMDTAGARFGVVRLKPLFSMYNAHLADFERQFPDEHKALEPYLEKLGIKDEAGNDAFTRSKLSTLLHQSQAIVGEMKGIVHPDLIRDPAGMTLFLNTQAQSHSVATASAEARVEVALDELADVVRRSDLDDGVKAALRGDIDSARSDPEPSRMKGIAKRFADSLAGASKDVAAKVITDLITGRLQLG